MKGLDKLSGAENEPFKNVFFLKLDHLLAKNYTFHLYKKAI